MTKSLIVNRYEPLNELGQGGMGVVYHAMDRLAKAPVALKQVNLAEGRLQFNMSQQRTSTEYFALAQEFRTLATLRHPHIISVLDYGFTEGKQPYFTMEYIPNAQTVTDYAKENSEHHLRLLTEILQALAYLHQRGIIHRDIKPGNILVNQQGQVKVLDFGLALEASAGPSEDMAGTLAYLAPELLGNGSATIQSDLYAVGIIAYEMFTGKHPFRLDSATTLLTDIMMSLPDTSMLNAQFATFVTRLMDREPEQRPDTARDAITELYRYVAEPPPTESAIIRESFLQASAFVGRDDELNTLREALAQLQTGSSTAWLIGGESGVGKSRLVEELRVRALVDGVRVLRGQAVSGQGVPYQLWRDILRPLLIATTLTDLEAGILKAIVPDIDDLIGRPITAVEPLSGAANQERLALTIIDVLRRQEMPLLLALEDLQWAAESLSPLEMLLPQLATLKVMVVGTYRIDETPKLHDELAAMQHIRLERLEAEAVAALSQSMLGEAGRQPELVTLINRETEGNVFFMVEVVRALAEEAGSLSDIGSGELPQRVMAGGMLEVLRRRLGRMPAWAQSPLKLAAVAGRQLDAKVLGQAAASLNFEDFLTAGANAAVFNVRDGVWEFAHDKLRETLLLDMSDADKATLHGQVAQAIEATYPDDETYAEVLAGHWDKAHQPAKALPYILRAAERMIQLTATYDRAAALLERGQALVAEDDTATRAELAVKQGDAARQRAENDKATVSYKYALSFKDVPPSVYMWTLIGLGLVSLQEGKFEEATTYASQSKEIAIKHSIKEGEAQTYFILGRVADISGHFDEARRQLQKSLAIYENAESKVGTAKRLMDIGITYAKQGKFDEAEDYFERSVNIQRKVGDRANVAGNLNNLGLIANFKKNTSLAKERFLESLDVSQEIYHRVYSSQSLENLGIISLVEDNITSAVTYFEKSLKINEEIDNLSGVSEILIYLAHAWAKLNNTDKAVYCLSRGTHLAQQINAIPHLLSAIIAGAQIAYLQDDMEKSAKLMVFAEQHDATPADDKALFLEPLKNKINMDAYQKAKKEVTSTKLEELIKGIVTQQAGSG